VIAELADFTKLAEKVRTHREKGGSCPPQPTPSINWAWCPWYGILTSASLGWLSGCAPSQLLHTCSLAEHGKLKKKSLIS